MRLFDSRFAYTALLWLLLPYVFFHLWWRSRKQPEYLDHVAERFGRYAVNGHGKRDAHDDETCHARSPLSNFPPQNLPLSNSLPQAGERTNEKGSFESSGERASESPREFHATADKPVIWLHTVSVGETRAAATLVHSLRAQYPQHQILLTHTTPTGRAASEQLYGDEVMRAYLPYDYPFAVQRFLDHFKPQVGVLLETEVWFNLIHRCKASNVPLLLLNARLSEKSSAKYARFPHLAHEGLHDLHLIAAQTDGDAQRLSELCGRAVSTMGNLKFDIEPPAKMLEQGRILRELFGKRPIFLAASTREGEEVLLLDALQNITDKDVLTIIVPRHPQRFDGVANLIEQRGLKMQRRSANVAIAADTQIVLGDSMGEMFAYYTACDIAFIGGSLLPFGGQNLIEACAVGKPVLIGPHTFNFAQATELAVANGAAIQVNDTKNLIHQLNQILSDTARSNKMQQAGSRFVKENQGATKQATTLIKMSLTVQC